MKKIRITEVDGRAVKPRMSLGTINGQRAYIEAGEEREVEDAIADAMAERGLATIVESAPVEESTPATKRQTKKVPRRAD